MTMGKGLEFIAEGLKWEQKASREDVAILFAKLKYTSALHAAILERIHLTQIAASGMSQGECLEWIAGEVKKVMEG